MGKIWIIIQREFMMGVRNRTFIIMSLAAPLFFVGIILVPIFIASQPGSQKTVVVCDNSGCPDTVGYAYVFKDTMNIKFDYHMVYKPIGEVKKLYRDSDNYFVLYIPENFMGGCDTVNEHSVALSCVLYSKGEPGFNLINHLQSVLTTEVQQDILGSNGISREVMELSRRKVSVTSEVKGQMSDTEIKFMAGLIFGMAVYIYILMFGVRVMKSVQEEKSTRIVEVIVSSVRPFQLMIGKIIAVALVALTQFTVWIILSMLIVVPIMNTIDDARLDHMKLQNANAGTAISVSGSNSGALTDIALNENTQETMEKLMSVPWNNLIPAFVFFFIFGYLMYASIFAALGSAADTESDTAQFSVPVTIPLIIAMASFSVVVNDPDGTVAKWLSMIPFTSPIVMLMRIPFGGVYMSELLLSMGILMASFFFMTWLAGRIYRVGILMYGKKVSWRELGKWLFYKG